MGEPLSLLRLARRRLDLLATTRDTMAGKYDRKAQPKTEVSRSHTLGAETVRLTLPLPETAGIKVSWQSQDGETSETLLPLSVIHDRASGWPEDLRDAWEERAAIIEHDGGETQEEAERRAYAEYEAAASGRKDDEDERKAG